jgi:uncharacterized membrane protein
MRKFRGYRGRLAEAGSDHREIAVDLEREGAASHRYRAFAPLLVGECDGNEFSEALEECRDEEFDHS